LSYDYSPGKLHPNSVNSSTALRNNPNGKRQRHVVQATA
jgi:hypothetical protein